MSLYLFLDICIFVIPLALSFDKRVRFYQRFPAIGVSSFVVGMIFLVWDSWAVSSGDWRFNDKYIIGIKFWNLPLEEILFFFVVPYSCLFIYEVICFFQVDKPVPVPSHTVWFLSFLSLIGAWFWREQTYSFAVLSVFSFTILVVSLLRPALFRSGNYWRFLGICLFPFTIFNGILTAVPVVLYNQSAIWGLRFTTIPLEDFFYAFALLTLNLAVYLFWEERRSSLKRKA